MKTLRSMLKSNGPLVIPGVYDAMGAKIAEKAEFEAMFQTGYGTSATLFGMPDYGFIGAAETADNARRICSAVSVPVIVDSDTGYGNALSVWKLVRELEAAGASGIFLEDQRWPKRCGHMQGKEVIPQEEYTEKLGAAIDARQSRDFVIVARTDARATDGLDAAIQRGQQNKKTGADAVFIEAPRSYDEMKRIGQGDQGAACCKHDRGRGDAATSGAGTLRHRIQDNPLPPVGAVCKHVCRHERAKGTEGDGNHAEAQEKDGGL